MTQVHRDVDGRIKGGSSWDGFEPATRKVVIQNPCQETMSKRGSAISST